jgi:hypothetical protein
LAILLSISPKQTKFLPSVCLVPADFSAVPVSISAVSLRRLSTYILIEKMAKNSKCTEKDIRKKRYQIVKLPNLCGNELIST